MASRQKPRDPDKAVAKKKAGSPEPKALDAAAEATLAVPRVEIEAAPGITDAFSQGGFAQLLIDCSGLQSTSLNRADVFLALASEAISVTLPQLDDDQVSVVIRIEDAQRAKETIEQHLHLACSVTDALALVTARAVDMRALAGVMSRARAALLAAGVDPVQVGDSHASLFVLVPEPLAEVALDAWRKEFQLDG
jgi:aspartokinase